MNSKKVFPVGKSIFWRKTISGIFWVFAGVAGVFDNLVCRILTILFLLAGVIALVLASIIDRSGNDADEMSDYNLLKAKANAGTVLENILCIVVIVFLLGSGFFQDLDINWSETVPQLFFVIEGVYSLLIGLSFRKLEDE